MLIFSSDFKAGCSPKTQEHLVLFEQGLESLRGMAGGLTLAWNPEIAEPRRLHNHYIDLLAAVYTTKFLLYSENLIEGLNRGNYFAYALNGRAILENVATLRYYLRHKYAPLLEGSTVDLQKVIATHDVHLRGSRFDWEAFATGRFQEMAEESLNNLKKKKDLEKQMPKMRAKLRTQQINVITCIEKWGMETPAVMLCYDFFCELVHPNIGSSFLTSSIKDGSLVFGITDGEPAGHRMFEQTFLWLLSIGYKEFGNQIMCLVLMKYQQDELDAGVN